MEKRLFLAMVLTALVLIGVPRLFSPPPSTVRRVDTTSPSTQAPSALAGDSLRDTRVTARKDTLDISGKPLVEMPVSAETVAVSTPLATYRFGSIGGSFLGAEVKSYQALTGHGGPVRLNRENESLLRYRLAFNGDTISLERLVFLSKQTQRQNGSTELTYTSSIGTGQLGITYTIVPDNYVINVRGSVNNLGDSSNLIIDLPKGLRSEEADSIEDQRQLAFAYKPVIGPARSVPFRSLDPNEQRAYSGPLTWVVVKNKYFLVGLLTPDSDHPFQGIRTVGGPRTSKVATIANGTVVEPVKNGEFQFEIYAGPQEYRRLLGMGREFQNANPYGGWLQRVVQPFATIVMQVLLWMRDTFRLNYGWVLVIFGIVVRLVLWPLNQRAMRASLRMQQIQPQLQEVQKRYQDNPEKQRTELMRVYKEHDMTPLSPMLGCLPMLLPMPILFALFFVFQNTIEFRGVSFLWLPDISLKDPFYIVPLLMGLSMFVLSWIGIRNAPPNPQAKLMAYFLPVMMTVVFLNFASGLNLYYAVQNIAALPQQWLIANERAKAAKPKT
jgi:YidC/Oxa1 family membrane protein insertase